MLGDYGCALSMQHYPPLQPAVKASPTSLRPSSPSFRPSVQLYRAQSSARSTTSGTSSSLHSTSTSQTSISTDNPKPRLRAGAGAAKSSQERRNTCFEPGKCAQEGRHGLKVKYINDHHPVDACVFCRQLGNPACRQQGQKMHAWCARCDKILCQECWGRSRSGYYEVTGKPQLRTGKLGPEAVKRIIRSLGKSC